MRWQEDRLALHFFCEHGLQAILIFRLGAVCEIGRPSTFGSNGLNGRCGVVMVVRYG